MCFGCLARTAERDTVQDDWQAFGENMFIPLSDANKLKHIRLQYVTLIIIAANCLIWLVMGTPALFGDGAIKATVYEYGFIPSVVNGYERLPAYLDGLPPMLTYVSYSFFHADFMHLAGNMLFIWVFGDNIEDALGHFKFLVFYLASAVAGAWLHGFMEPQSSIPLIGASGAAAGIVGAYILLHPKIRIWVLALGKIPLRIPAIFVLGAWIGFQVYQFSTDTTGQVSWAAHVGGIIMGVILLFVLKSRDVVLFDRDVDVVVPEPVGVPKKVESPPVNAGKLPMPGSVPAAGKSVKRRWGRNADSNG